jgi:hypothetical protein
MLPTQKSLPRVGISPPAAAVAISRRVSSTAMTRTSCFAANGEWGRDVWAAQGVRGRWTYAPLNLFGPTAEGIAVR